MTGIRCVGCGHAAAGSAVSCPTCGAPLGDSSGGGYGIQAVGHRLGRALGSNYRVEELIGRGGYALVYRVHDQLLDRKLAAKTLLPELARSEEVSERFRREAQTAARLHHPNIVQIYFVGTAEDVPCYVMPLIEGEPLAARIRREGQLPFAVALGVARDVAGALDFAHQAGVIHRDVKPDNILLEIATGRSLLMDFGIAKALQGAPSLTVSGVVVGTPHYMSPEQATGDKGVGPTTDVYALGIVVYEMLVGDPPFGGRVAQSIVAQHVTDPVPPMSEKRPDMTRAVDEAVRRALAKMPADRFATSGEFVRALERAHGQQSLRRSQASIVVRQDTDDIGLFRTLEAEGIAQPVAALRAASDITSVSEASRAAEARARDAAGSREGAVVAAIVKALKTRSEDPQPGLRQPARDALRRLAAEGVVVESLALLWQSGPEQHQPLAEQALSYLMPECGDGLVALARREKSPQLFLCAERVGALDDTRAEAIARDPSGSVVAAFAGTLRESSRPVAAIERWLGLAMRHSNPEVRAAVVDVAGARGGGLAERVARLAMSDAAPAVRVAAVRALGRSRQREAFPELARVLEQGTVDEQAAAADGIGALGMPDAAGVLARVFERTRMLRKERGPVQVAAARALAVLPGEQAGLILGALARDRDAVIAEIAIKALAERVRAQTKGGGRGGLG